MQHAGFGKYDSPCPPFAPPQPQNTSNENSSKTECPETRRLRWLFQTYQQDPIFPALHHETVLAVAYTLPPSWELFINIFVSNLRAKTNTSTTGQKQWLLYPISNIQTITSPQFIQSNVSLHFSSSFYLFFFNQSALSSLVHNLFTNVFRFPFFTFL